MKRWKWTKTLLCMTVLLVLSGCSFWPTKPVYMPPGSHAEVARNASIRVWVTNKETKKKELRKVDAQPGYFIVRPRVEDFGNAE